MRRFRIGVFGRATAAEDGGADTLLRTLGQKISGLSLGNEVQLVDVPWSDWSHRRRPLRYAWSRIVRRFGGEIPLVDLRPLCRNLKLDIAYFAAPAFVHIDIPFVFTVWDIGHRTIPEFPEMRSGRDPWTQREALYRRMLAQASYVITGNEAGATELREFFGLDRKKVVAVPFPNPDFSGIAAEMPDWRPVGHYFLYPAQLWPHKNHVTLLKALRALTEANLPVPALVFVGADKGILAHLKWRAADLGVGSHVHFGGFVRRGELKALYQNATGLVFPSLLGPNNLPPQEATMLGCASILSDLPGHREQLHEGAIYVPPLDAAAWGEAMLRLMSDKNLCGSLVAKASIATASCSVEAYAAQVGALLSRLVAIRGLWPG